MAGREIEGPILPHSDFGDPDCCGTLWPLERPGQPGTADIICNECDAVVRTVPTADLQRTLDEMESTLEVASAKCPHCGAVNLFPGFTQMLAYVCTECGEPVKVSDDSAE
jgi:DNA-directed RNA polymerase subunit RPC12/RpoP